MTVLIDTCVILDALQERRPFDKEAKAIIDAVAEKRIDGIITLKRLLNGLAAIFSPLRVRDSRLAKLNRMSDREALALDWYVVGADLKGAMTAYGINVAT